MINIQVSSINIMLLCSVLVVLWFYYFKYMIFYYENKDKINTHEKKNNQKMSYNQFRFQKRLYGGMSQKDIDIVNNSSKEYQEQQIKEYEDYLKEGI